MIMFFNMQPAMGRRLSNAYMYVRHHVASLGLGLGQSQDARSPDMDQYHSTENKQSLYAGIYEYLALPIELLACFRRAVVLCGVEAFTEDSNPQTTIN